MSDTTATNVVEIVTFKLYDYVSDEQFMQSNKTMTAFLASQPGFMYRSLVKQEQTNEWSDIVYWGSQVQAEAAGKAFMASEQTKAMINLIDKNTVTMKHLPVLWQYYPEMDQVAS